LPSDPLVLGFDTSAAHCAAALLSGDRIVAQRHEDMARGQAERLMPLLQEVLAESGVRWQDLTALGTGVGPGNFTGIRISVAAARGLALALDIPAVGVSTLEALAFGAEGPVTVTVDARRGRVYAQNFPGGAPELLDTAPDGPRVTAPRVPIAEAIARIAADRAGSGPPPPAPLYLRPADAAPARDRGPVLLEER
jgi:tRNA threonylcarbamoyl adenosine modification protein YeaZ